MRTIIPHRAFPRAAEAAPFPSVAPGAAFFGLALIVGSFLIFNDDTPWPGYACLMPVIGTFFVILATDEKSWFTGNMAAQWIGKASYSIYLWHWPIFVGLGYFGCNGCALTGVASALILGGISYAAIETPCRDKMVKWPRPQAWKNIVLFIAVIAGAGFAVFAAQGLPQRVSPEILAIDHAAENRYAVDKNCGFKGIHALKRCHIGSSDDIRFVVWGDSHAGVIADPVAEAARGGGLIYTLGCPTIFEARLRTKVKAPCREFNEMVLTDIKSLPKNIPVIIINRFSYYLSGFNEGIKKRSGIDYFDVPEEDLRKNEAGIFKKKLTESLCRISKERKLYVVKPIAEMGQDVPKTMARHLMAERPAPDIFVSKAEYAKRHRVTLEALADAQKRCGVKLLDPLPYLCEQGKCSSTRNGKPLYFDDDHLSAWGSRFLVPLFKTVFSKGRRA